MGRDQIHKNGLPRADPMNAPTPPLPLPPGLSVRWSWIHRSLSCCQRHKAGLASVGLVGGLAVAAWLYLNPGEKAGHLVHGNGRIEATEVDIATKTAGRLEEVLVNEGDFVVEGQILARIQSDAIQAQLAEAEAQHRQAGNAVISASAQARARESDKRAAEAVVIQRESELFAEKLRMERSETLAKRGALAAQTLDDDRARVKSSEAAISAAKAQVAAAEAAIEAAKAQVEGANSTVEAAAATIARIKADIADCTLRSPRAGRVQYRITQPGEVLGAGGKVLNIVDLSDVYMTFFLPETVVGRVALGAEARVVLDAVPQYVIPARVSYVASVAQFTPKTVETASERQKLMFRVKARIDPGLLLKHLRQVKTGVPGTTWLNLDPNAPWPQHLTVKVPE